MSTTGALLAHLAVGLAAVQVASAGELAVVSVEPAAHSLTAPVAAAISVHFDQPVLPASITSDSFSGTHGVDGDLVFGKVHR